MGNEMTDVAMDILLNSGDAHLKIEEGLELGENGDLEAAKIKLEEAKEYISKAHNAQTNLIVEEASGQTHEISILFIHAQDTMMTTKRELTLAKHLIKIMEMLSNK